MATTHDETRQHGFGLLEMILVFVLVLVAGALVFTVFQAARTNAESDSELTRLTALGASLRTSAFGTPPDYRAALGSGVVEMYGLNNTVAGLNILSKFYPIRDGKAVNQWGGQVYLNSNDREFGFGLRRGSQYMIVLTQVPLDVCPKILAGMNGLKGGFWGMGVMASNRPGQGNVFNQGSTPFSALASTCQSEFDFAGDGGHLNLTVFGL